MFIQQQWNLYKPVWTSEIIVIGIVLGAMIFIIYRKEKYSFWRLCAALVLYVFLFVLFSSTVFSRPDYGYYNYKLELFWSYRAVVEKGNEFLARQIFMNIFVFVPVGCLFPLTLPRAPFKQTFLFGLACSGMIEILQLLMQRGLFEWDDIIHNTLGTCIGYTLFWFMRKCIRKGRSK